MNRFLDSWRPGFHLSPSDGWMSDPVGLCRMGGLYHVFFQYSQGDAEGTAKRAWGHFAGKSLTDLKYMGVAFPPTDYEKDGIYPGSSLVDEDGMHLFYTGTIRGKGPDPEAGRIANQMYIHSADGKSFDGRTLLLTNKDYPDDVTAKVRDPKVWKEEGRYFMVLAAGRKKETLQGDVSEENKDLPGNGCVLIYSSPDMKKWEFLKEIYIPEGFGYQWECPDYFRVNGHTVLSVCPQGVAHREFHFQNHYSSGYFMVEGETEGGQIVNEKSFHEWDQGFDFYAPQTFEDTDGRRILVAWAGMPDARYFNLTAAKEGWQGLLTVPREITMKGGKLLQSPVREILALRQTRLTPMNGEPVTFGSGTGEILVGAGKGSVRIRIGSLLQPRVVTLEYEEGVVTLSLASGYQDLSPAAAAAAKAVGAVLSAETIRQEEDIRKAASEAAGGRKIRRAEVGELKNIRVLVDTSVIEIYINDGEHVMTTRYYPNHKDSTVRTINVEYGFRPCQSWEYGAITDPYL